METSKRRLLSCLVVLAASGVALAMVVVTDARGRVSTPTLLASAGVLVFAMATLFGITLVFFDSFALIWAIRKEDHRAESLAKRICPTCGYDVRANAERCSECGEPLPAELNQVPETPAIRRLIRAAVAEAKAAGSDHAGTQHVLLAILQEPGSAGAQILESLGVGREVVLAELESLRADVGVGNADATSTPN